MHASKSHSRASQSAQRAAQSRQKDQSAQMPADMPSDMKDQMHQASQTISTEAHRHPALTVVGVSALGLLAASMIGVGEVAIAGAAGYLAYRWLTRSRHTQSQQS